MISAVVLDKPHECAGFYCEPITDRYPCDGVHYDTLTGKVPTYICLHYPDQCQYGAETTYFLLKCLALGRISVDDWIYLYPVNGDRNLLVPTFSDEVEDECVGFEIRTDGRDRVPAIKNSTILQAPYDFHPRTKKIHTSPCLHLAECGFAYTGSRYALMQACIRNPSLLVKEGLGKDL